ncbi:hypothetical protein PP707_06335 [Acetobacter pasteurianus]|nr:hypothetical protein [Acetobacter pasteurianus]
MVDFKFFFSTICFNIFGFLLAQVHGVSLLPGHIIPREEGDEKKKEKLQRQ